MQIYLRPANKTGAPDSPIAATPYKKFKVARGVERDDLRVAKINEISAKRFKALNQAILGKDYDAKLHQKVRESPNMSVIVFLDDTPIGSMICEKWETGGLRLLEVMTMGVLDEHKEWEDHLATITQLAQSGFTFWLPIPQFYRQNTRNDVYYIKKTSRIETKTIVAEIAEETGIEETQRVQPLDLKFDVKSFDVSKLISLTHSLVIEDVTQDTIEVY
uniref:N-acetyltransferase n=1 Tax=Caenorhabditis tropicalis TaxID=1561998 RepID=A0A1I7SYF4_9PELO